MDVKKIFMDEIAKVAKDFPFQKKEDKGEEKEEKGEKKEEGKEEKGEEKGEKKEKKGFDFFKAMKEKKEAKE